MSIEDTRGIIEILREQLQPKGTMDIVRLQMKSSAFFTTEFVQGAIDELEQKANMAAAELDTLSNLEKLAFHLLIDSAEL